MAFAGIEDQMTGSCCYGSSLPEGLGVPERWPEDCHVEELVRGNERRERKRVAERERVDFVPARAGEGVEGNRSKVR